MEEFLQPISESDPSGAYLRYDPVYDNIRDARRTEEADQSLGIWQPADPKGNDWEAVREMCDGALLKRSKDLQIAYWRLEALAHLDGFAGLADGVGLFTALMNTFWPTIYPQIDDDGDISFRLVPIRQLVQDLPTLLYTLPITYPRGELPILSLFDYLRAKKGEGDIPADTARKSFLESDRNWLKQTVLAIKTSTENLTHLEEVAYQHCGYDTPSFKDLHALLNDILDAIKANVPEVFETAVEGDGQFAEAEEVFGSSTGGGRAATQDTSRVGAYRMLTQALNILEKAEPHSPVVVILRHIIDWEVKGLHAIAESLQSNDSSLATLLKTFPAQIE